MSYLTQSKIADNMTMRQRIAQAVAGEITTLEPDDWTLTKKRWWAAAPGWDTAWAYALNVSPEQDPGANEAVITDAMILAQVQSMLNG